MAHKPFNLYKRLATKKNQYTWYVRFYDEEGNRLAGRSTGKTSKSAAETWAYEQLKKGIIATERNITFGKYAQDWWIWGKCQYVKGKIARGGELSRAYVNLMRAYLDNHILPYFNNKKLQKINTRMIENWILCLREKHGRTDKPLSHSTVNHGLIYKYFYMYTFLVLAFISLMYLNFVI